DIAALGQCDAEIGEHARLLGPEESHGEQDQLDLQRELATRTRLEFQPAAFAHHVDLYRFEGANPSLRVAEKALRGDRIDPLAALLVGAGDAEDVGPLGPRIVGGALIGWPRQEPELMDGPGTLTVHRAQAVGAGIATADDDDALALRRNELCLGDRVALAAPVLERQVLHGEVDAAELAAGYRQIARPARAASQDDRVKIAAEVPDSHVDADVRPGTEDDAGLLHDPEPAVEKTLFHLELGNAVAQQTADPVVALEHGRQVAGPIQLLGGREARRPGAHHRDAFARTGRGRLGGDRAFVEGALDDGQLDALDGHRIVVDPEHARALARRRAETTGPLREVVRRVQAVERLAPVV